MNEKDILQLIQKHEHDRGSLSYTEKVMMHSRIMQTAAQQHTQNFLTSNHVSWFQKHWQVLGQTALAFGIIISIGAGTVTHASARALPGDALYKFKVTVREPMIALTKNKDAGHAYALQRVEERYHEITVLAQKKQLTPERGAEALTYLKKQTEEVTKDTTDQKPIEGTGTASVTEYLKKTRTVSSTITARSQALAEVSTAAGTDKIAAAIVEEAQIIAAEGIETLTETTNEVIQAIPTDEGIQEVNDVVLTLEDEVKTLPQITKTAKDLVSEVTPASPLSMLSISQVNAPTAEVSSSVSVDITLNEIDTLIEKLSTVVQEKTEAAKVLQATTTQEDITSLYIQAKAAKEDGKYQTALELLHKTLELYETSQKTIELQKEATSDVYKPVSSVSESSTISSKMTASPVDAL